MVKKYCTLMGVIVCVTDEVSGGIDDWKFSPIPTIILSGKRAEHFRKVFGEKN